MIARLPKQRLTLIASYCDEGTDIFMVPFAFVNLIKKEKTILWEKR